MDAQSDQLCVPAINFCPSCSTLVLFHGGFARYTPKQVSLRRFPLLRGRSHASTLSNTSVELILRHSVPSPFRRGTEFTENPFSKCETLGVTGNPLIWNFRLLTF